jgi:PAS domain S-box-containing protein
MSNIGKLGLCVGKGITGWVAERGDSLLVNDVREDGRYICGDENICSEMCAPLKVGEKVIGVIDAQSKELNAFSENDLRLLNIVAGQIATIIENVRLYEEIKQSEEKYKTVVEAALDGICIIGKDYQIKYVNEKLVEIQGYSREEQIGRDLRSFLAEESKALLAGREAQRKKGVKASPYFELTILHKGGGIRHVEASARNIKDSKGNVNTIAILKDITDRKQGEEALRQSEEEARRLAQENAIMAKIGRIISSTLNIEEVYEPFAAEVRQVIPFDRVSVNVINPDRASITITYAFGIKVGALQVGDILPLDDPLNENVVSRRQGILIQAEDESELVNKGYPNLVKHFRAGIRSAMTVPLISKDQVIGIFHLQSLKPNAYTELDLRLAERVGNQIAGAIANAQLFSERKQAEEALRQSEEKYRTILESIQDGYFEVDLAGNFTFVNDVTCRHLGYSREELIGMNNRQYSDETTAKRMYQVFNRVYRAGEPVKVFDIELIKKDRTKVISEISVSLIRDSEGKPIGFRGISRDITEKKRMEEQLLQSEKLRAVGEMASGVAHDFNNALAAILGNTQLLLYTAKDEELKGSLKVIEKVARGSAQTVRRLQDFTRKSVHQELFKVDVNSIVKDSIEITKPKWKDEVQGRGIHIEMVSNFEEIPTVIGSTSELREVFTNMIFNAIEAMPEGGKIEIRTFQRKSNVSIQISDTGIGMTEEVKKKIFEPFFTTKPFSNTGLGLSMSYGVIKRFGGEIEVESKVGHGTTFTIILPIGLEGKEEVDVSPIIKKGREARILVIDDEGEVRSVLSRILSQVNHQVTMAEDGEEGIRLFKEKDFDLVLTDLGMPGMSGWEVCRAIKKMSPRTPVGMITGWGVEIDQSKIEENGIDFVIPKPFQFGQILKVVDETMASKGSHL